MEKLNFDIVVVGGGAAGLFAASVANTLGAKTCLLDRERLGGDCTWFGCVPSKALLKSGEVAHNFKKAYKFGIKINGGYNLNSDDVMSHVGDIVREVAKHEEASDFEKKGIKVIFGAPRFTGPLTIAIGDKELVSKKIIICTGSHPMVPPIEGLKSIDYLTNETIFSVDRPPKSLIVLGGGPIGAEISQALERLGVKVTIVEMLDLLVKEDRELADFVIRKFKEEGINVLTGMKAVKFAKTDTEVTVTIEDKNGKRENINAEKVLVAVGRAPNIEGLNLESAGVKYSSKGININDYLQTTNKNIFACGDVASMYQFTHAASYGASICVRNALYIRPVWQKVNYSNIVWSTFTDPELSHLGLSEEEAGKKYKGIKVYKTSYKECDRAVTDMEKEGMVKIITDKKGYILGAKIVGSKAGEIIQGLMVAKSQKIPLSKLATMMYIFPTLSELIKKTAAKNLVEVTANPIVKILLKLLRQR